MNKVNGMKAGYTVACIAILLLFTVPVFAQETATINGVAYGWDTFYPLNNTVIEVNSTPIQSVVARCGIYSFDLPKGTYLITARYFEDEQLTYYAEENITVSGNGSYTVDLLLLPAYPDESSENGILSSRGFSSLKTMVISLLLVSIIALVLFYRLRIAKQDSNQGKKTTKTISKLSEDLSSVREPVVCEETFIEKQDVQSRTTLSSEQLEIIEILRGHGGHISQKELRGYLDYSEGKASLLIVDLENRGYLRKVRKGRGNDLFLIEEDESLSA
ncbi:MAG: hypothetical protein R2741_02170 [Methanolobus sp.]